LIFIFVFQIYLSPMKRTSIFIICFIHTIFLLAQEVPYSKQFFVNKFISNAGAVGAERFVRFTGIYRTLWEGFEGSPQTVFSTVEIPSYPLHGAVGAYFMYDRFDVENTLSFKAAYAYKMYLDKGVFQLGVAPSLIKKRIDLVTGVYSDVNETFYNIDAGAYFQNEKIFWGASVVNMLESEYEDFDSNLRRSFHFTGGYRFRVKPRIEAQPSFLVRFSEENTEVDVNLNVYLFENLWAGALYSTQEEFSFLMGADFNSVLLGYAYNISTSSTTRNFNSQEIMLILRFITSED
jgi:type IX secretion system PorP/SprF family membrane protein